MPELNHINSQVYIKEERDDFAISFADWCVNNELFYSMKYGRIKTKQLLEIFKKENGY